MTQLTKIEKKNVNQTSKERIKVPKVIKVRRNKKEERKKRK